jgi:Domain of unknown function (DUF4399)
MTNRLVIAAAALVFGIAANACTSKPAEEAKTSETPAAAPAESHEGHQAAKVYFKEPKDGATVSSKSTVKFVFGADNYQISPVPPDAKEARPNMGHFHFGVNTDCLAPGTTIPKAEEGDKPGTAGKWVHFGKGTDVFEMALNPGDYKFSLEVGDDLHRAVEGMCETIKVKVE